MWEGLAEGRVASIGAKAAGGAEELVRLWITTWRGGMRKEGSMPLVCDCLTQMQEWVVVSMRWQFTWPGAGMWKGDSQCKIEKPDGDAVGADGPG